MNYYTFIVLKNIMTRFIEVMYNFKAAAYSKVLKNHAANIPYPTSTMYSWAG